MQFGVKEKNAVILPHSAQSKNEFLGEIKEMSKTNKLPSRQKTALELLHIYQVTDPPVHFWLGILLIFVKI